MSGRDPYAPVIDASRRDVLAFDRLADLIYQGDTSLSCRDIVACDREALGVGK